MKAFDESLSALAEGLASSFSLTEKLAERVEGCLLIADENASRVRNHQLSIFSHSPLRPDERNQTGILTPGFGTSLPPSRPLMHA